MTPVGHTINSSIQCVAMRGLWSDLDADRASDPTPNDTGGYKGRSAYLYAADHATYGSADTQSRHVSFLSGRN